MRKVRGEYPKEIITERDNSYCHFWKEFVSQGQDSRTLTCVFLVGLNIRRR